MEAREGSPDAAVASSGTPPPFYPTPALDPFYPAPPPPPAFYPSSSTTTTSHVPHNVASDGADSNAVASSSTNNDQGNASPPLQSQSSLPPWRRRGYVPPGNAYKALKGLPFTGTLTEDQICKLHAEFDDDLLCPGVTGRVFGNYADADGLVYLPDVAEGYKAVRRTLRSWQTMASTEDKFNWWPESIQIPHHGIGPMKVSRLLSGLPKQTWLRYQGVYRTRSGQRVERLARERAKAKRKQKRAEAEAEATAVAVAAVASMSSAPASWGSAEGA